MTIRHPPFGFHGAIQGITDYVRTLDAAGIPAALKAVNDAGWTRELVLNYQNADHQFLLRYTNPSGRRDDHPDLSRPPKQQAEEIWTAVRSHVELTPDLSDLRDRWWIEPTNEIDTHANAAYLATFAVELVRLARADGYRVLVPGFNAGQPHDPVLWTTTLRPLLEIASSDPENIGLSCHEGKTNIGNVNAPIWMEDQGKWNPVLVPHMIGRLIYLYDAARALGLPAPASFITEWAWAYNDMPEPETAMRDVRHMGELYQLFPMLRALCFWNLQTGSQWGDLRRKLQKIIPDVTDYVESTTWDVVVPPPPEAEPVITNPSFEAAWTTLPNRNQQPAGWGMEQLPDGTQMTDTDRRASALHEAIHRPSRTLPDHQRPGGGDPLILDGDVVYKMHTVHTTAETRLSPDIHGLEPGGHYLLTIPVRLHMHEKGPDESEPDDSRVMAQVNGETVGVWNSGGAGGLGSERWNYLALEVVGNQDGRVDLNLIFQNQWEHPRDWFVDDLRIEPVPNTDPPPDEEEPFLYTVRAHWLPQDTTQDQVTALLQGTLAGRNTVVYSYHDAHRLLKARYDPPEAQPFGPNERSLLYVYGDHNPAELSALLTDGVSIETRDLPGERPPAAVQDITDDLTTHPTLRYSTRPLSAISAFTIHHTVSPPDRPVDSIASFHVNGNGWPGIGYHFVIKDDGSIFQTNKLETISYHAGSSVRPNPNTYSVGIALQGNFQEEPPPQAQLDAARWLVGHLDGQLPGAQDVKGHREMPRGPGEGTACPGNTYTAWLPYVAGGTVGDPPDLVDLTPAFRLDAAHGPIYEVETRVNGEGRGQQRHQTQRDGSVVYFTKGGDGINPSEWEQLRVDLRKTTIERFVDYSHSATTYYDLRDAAGRAWVEWLKRKMFPGEVFVSSPLVTYRLKVNCQVYSGPTAAVDYLTFVGVHPSWPAYNGITLDGVFEVNWKKSPTGQVLETYFLGPDFGLVGWRDDADGRDARVSEIHRVPGSRPNNVRAGGPCLDLGL